MKKIVYSTVQIILCISLLFLPIASISHGYNSTIALFANVANEKFSNIFRSDYIFETLLLLFAICILAFKVLFLIRPTKTTNLFSSSSIWIYVAMWILRLYIPYGNTGRLSLKQSLNYGNNKIWYALYIIILLALIVISILPLLSFRRRPSKVQQLEQRVAELEKQVQDNSEERE